MFFILGLIYLVSLYLLGSVGTGILAALLISRYRSKVTGGGGELLCLMAVLHILSFTLNTKVLFGFNVCIPFNHHLLDAIKVWANLDIDLQKLFYGALATIMPFAGVAVNKFIEEKIESEFIGLIGCMCSLTTYFFLILAVIFHDTALIRWWAHYTWF